MDSAAARHTLPRQRQTAVEVIRYHRKARWWPMICWLAAAAVLAAGGPVRGLEGENALHLTVATGEVRDFTVQLPPDLPALQVRLGSLTAPNGDIEPEDVVVGFAAADALRPERWSKAAPAPRGQIQIPAGAPLRLRAAARRCSTPGNYQASLWLSPVGPSGGAQVVLPLRLDVAPGGPCGRIYVGAGAAALIPLVIGFISFCTWSMWRRSCFVPLDALARKLRPQSWQKTELTRPNPGAGAAAEVGIRRAVPWRQRLSAWTVSWRRRLWRRPWLALAGGEPYRETIKVGVANAHHLPVLDPIPEPAPVNGLAAPGQGSLYVVATTDGRVRFVARPDMDGKVGYLDLEPAPPSGRAELELTTGTQLLSRTSYDDDPTGPAGWRLG